MKEEEEEGEYQDCIDGLKHYDLQNPITQTAAHSRLKGKTLEDGIARGILKKLKNKAEVKGKIKLENPTTTSLGIQGFDFLISKQKKKEKEDLVQTNAFQTQGNYHTTPFVSRGKRFIDRDLRQSEVGLSHGIRNDSEED